MGKIGVGCGGPCACDRYHINVIWHTRQDDGLEYSDVPSTSITPDAATRRMRIALDYVLFLNPYVYLNVYRMYFALFLCRET